MATFNIETTIASGSYHKRSTGMTGQVLASADRSQAGTCRVTVP